MKTLLLSVILVAGVLTAQTTVNLPSLTVSADATTAINAWMTTQFSGTNTSTTASISDNGTTLTVGSTAGIAATALLMVDGEVMQSSAKTATTFTITRAALGTTATAHNSGAVVRELKYRSMALLFGNIILQAVGQILENSTTGVIATQNAVITTAQAAKEAAKATAVQ